MIFDSRLLAHNLLQEVLVEDCYKVRQLFNTKISTVVDIGANYGLFSTLSRFYWPLAEIHAIEPHAETHKGLQQNVNHLHVHTHRLALGEEGFVAMQAGGRSSGVAVSKQVEAVTLDSIPSMRLPELFKRIGVRPGPEVFLKIDVEGAERFLRHHQASEELLLDLGGFGMEIHAQTSKWPTSPTKTEWLQWLNDRRGPMKLHNMDVDIYFGTNIGYFCGRRIP